MGVIPNTSARSSSNGLRSNWKPSGSILVLSHQPLAGPGSIDNASEVQALLNKATDKVLLAVNGHTHIDLVARAGKLSYLHLNSASYKWVGSSHRHKSYPPEVHSKFHSIEYTCPYLHSLFATLTIDPIKRRIDLGTKSNGLGNLHRLRFHNHGLTNKKNIS